MAKLLDSKVIWLFLIYNLRQQSGNKNIKKVSRVACQFNINSERQGNRLAT